MTNRVLLGAETRTAPRRLQCFKCGRLLAKAYDVSGCGVIEIQCWSRNCKALNGFSIAVTNNDVYRHFEK